MVAIGEETYASLAEALAAAQAGDTIKFLANITEDVTVSTKVTIDGAGKTYTGKMILKADTTIKNVNFDGKGYNGYAVETRGANYVTIEDCTAKNYGYGFVQLASGTALTTVKNVTVSNMNYGVKVDYSNAVVLENVDITVNSAAVLNSNYGEKTITIKNSKLNILGTWKRNDTTKTNYVFEGENTVGEFKTDAAIDSFELAVDATVTAPNTITATATEAGYSVKYVDGKYIVKANMVAIGEETYASLAEALAAAKAGDTITFLADITEDVTIKKNLTIDGANFKYTGNIAVADNNAAVTVKNVNFVNGTGYAITTDRISSITVLNCTVDNYNFGFLYANKSTPTVVVKDVTVSNCSYGLHYVYGSNATLENVTMINVTKGLYIQNYASKTITVKNSTITSIAIWERSGYSGVQTFKFEGNNTVGTLSTSQYAKYVLVAADATLTAPEGVTVTTNVEGYIVKYVDGKYVVKGAVAKVGNNVYATLQEAINAAQNGETVILLENINLTSADVKTVDNLTVMFSVSGEKAITLDLNGKKISLEHLSTTDRIYAVIYVANKASLTVTDSSEEKTGGIDVKTHETSPKVAYMFLKAGPEGNLTINGGYFHMNNSEDSMVYTNGSDIVNVNGGTFILDMVGERVNGFPCIFNTKGNGERHVNVTGGTFNYDVNHQYWIHEVQLPATRALKNNGDGTWTVVDAVAYIREVYDTYGHEVGYATLQEAIDAAKDGEVIILLVDVTVESVVNLNGAILNLNGYTFTGTVLGTVQISNGNWITAEGYKMIGVDADYYISSDAVVNVAANELTIVSGTVTLAQSWRTLPGQNIVVGADATFVVPADMIFEIYDNTSVVVNGTLTVNGTVELKMGATLTAPSGLNVVTKIQYYVVQYVGGVYSPVELPDVAEVNGVKYKFLAEAIAAAKAGDTITFLADITEDVTINKNLTIDGADYNYTGNISVKGSAVGVVVKNVNFVNGTGYAITTNTIKSITVENCTVDNYGYGFLYANKSTPTVVVKGVTVSNCNYGFHYVYGSNATLENVVMTNVAKGIYIQNYASKTITVKNSEITSIAIWERSGYSGVQTFKFEGNNTVGTLSTSQYAKYQLAKKATVATTEIEKNFNTISGYKVSYVDGKYQVVTNFVATYENMRFGNTLSLLYAIPQYEELVEGCYVAFVHGETTEKVYINAWTPTLIGDVNYYVVEYSGLAAKQMTDIVSVTFYDADGNALGETFVSSIKGYATRVLDPETGDSEFHDVVIAMLNYGAAAQIYFEYNTEALANADLSDAQKNLTAFTRDEDHREVVGKPADKALFKASGVRFNDSINLIFQFQGISHTAEGLTVRFIKDETIISVEKLAYVKDDNAWAVELDTLVIADAYEVITCEITDGTNTLTITDSVAGYITRRLASVEENSAAANLYTAFMNFADAAGAKPANQQ